MPAAGEKKAWMSAEIAPNECEFTISLQTKKCRKMGIIIRKNPIFESRKKVLTKRDQVSIIVNVVARGASESERPSGNGDP